MNLRTTIEPLSYPWNISYRSKTFFTGSCFAEEVGKRCLALKFNCLINPLGIHFNPVSLSESIRYVADPQLIKEDHLVERDGRWHHFGFHGMFSGPTPGKTLLFIRQQLKLCKNFLEQADLAFITLGTAQVHYHLPTNQIVANNHKFPSALFESRMLGLSQITDALNSLIISLKQLNPDLKIIFTVSPVRYLSNGMHANQLSKSLLLLAAEQMKDDREIFYFPAYEIFMDDLRDYRYYGEDMVHPSKTGVDYTWEILTKAAMSEQTLANMSHVKMLMQSFHHRPIYPESKDYAVFLQKLMSEMSAFSFSHPDFDFSKELAELGKRLEVSKELK